MKNVLISLLVIGGIVFLVLLLNPLLGGLHSFSTDNTTASYSVALNATTTGANVTLPKALFNGDIQYASATSNLSIDVPLITTYIDATRVLQITGLVASQNRTLTIAYEFGALDASTQQVANFTPTAFMFGVIVLILLAIVGAVVAVARR
jgi:hypothetical protein